MLFCSIFFWRHACELLEEAGEMLRVLESEVISNLCDAAALIHKHLLAEREHVLLNEDLCAHARLLPHEVAEIAWREACLVSKPRHGRETLGTCFLVCKIILDVSLKVGENVRVDLVACDELPVVESLTVVEDKLDAVGEDRL